MLVESYQKGLRTLIWYLKTPPRWDASILKERNYKFAVELNSILNSLLFQKKLMTAVIRLIIRLYLLYLLFTVSFSNCTIGAIYTIKYIFTQIISRRYSNLFYLFTNKETSSNKQVRTLLLTL